MDIKKLLLYALLAMLGASLWSAWQHDRAAKSAHSAATTAQVAVDGSTAPPVGVAPGDATANQTTDSQAPAATTSGVPQGVSPHTSVSQHQQIPAARLVHVKTDLLQADIDLQGGNLVQLKLVNYPTSLKDKSPISLLNSDPNSLYIMQSGMVAAAGYDHIKQPITYSVTKRQYQLQPNQHGVDVVLTGTTANQLKVTKTYHFLRNHYAFRLSYKVVNQGTKAWHGSFYTQLLRRDIKQTHQNAGRAFVGVSISSPEKHYHKLSYSKLNQQPLSQNIHGGWVAMQQHYFLTALLPAVYQTNHYYSRTSEANVPAGALYTVGYAAPQMQLKAGASAQGEMKSYMGPALSDRLKQTGEHLELSIDYGWLWPISSLIFYVMKVLHGFVANWGWSIILVTLVIKLIFYPLTNKSFVSMAKMKELAPRMQKLKDIHGDDKQALSQATMKLYREQKVNPLGGCLPMLIQIPVFIALYYVLIESVQLRQAPFILWVHDLSVKDPFYVLPILMGASMFLQQKLTPQAGDPAQAKMMMFLPVIFTVLFLNFPAGLVLYWLTNNVLSIAQQWYVNAKHEKAKKYTKHRKK